jgi:hypothetical protein
MWQVAAMQSFIVLGIIPGTNLQTTFNFWVMMASMLFCVPLVSKIIRHHMPQRIYQAVLQVAQFMYHYQYQLPA